MPGNFFSFLAAFGLSVVLTVGLRTLAIRTGFLDIPDSRKVHHGAVPLCGGLAIFCAFAFADLLFSTPSVAIPWNLAAALALLVVSGAVDDRWHLPAAPRLLVHFLAAGLFVLPHGIFPTNFAGIMQEPLPLVLVPVAGMLAVVFAVGVVNATNMSDGADGLAGGWTAGALFWLALIARDIGRTDLAFIGLLLLAAVLGFLAFNMRHPWRSRASVFMGDAGSIGLGGLIGFMIIALSSGGNGTKSVSFLLLLWTVVIPVTDMASLVVRRIAVGRSPMSADRWHMHHLLLDLGVSHVATTGVLVLAVTACGAVAWTGHVLDVPEPVLVLGLLLPIAAHSGFVWWASRRIGRRPVIPAGVATEIATNSIEGTGR